MNNDINTKKIIIITGAASGIGLAASIYLTKMGHTVYAGILNDVEKERLTEEAIKNNITLKTIQIDVNDHELIKNGIATILNHEGRIDALVNNAGYGLAGFLEDCSIEEMKKQFETNFFGAMRLIKEILPIMRKQKSGYIINISSVFGRISLPITSAYNASKAALSAITDALRMEMAPFGIKATAIEPLNIKTNFNKTVIIAEKSKKPESPYKKYMDFYMSKMNNAHEKNLSNPVIVAEKILQILNTKNIKARYLIGQGAKTAIIAKNILPNRLFEKMLKKKFMGI